MRQDRAEDINVYGSNLPQDAPEADTAADLDHTREKRSGEGGGMGRDETPRDAATQGEWHRDAAQDDDRANAANPKPPLHAPLSDETPS